VEIMSYANIEAALLTRIQNLSNYSTTNSSRGDYRVLGAGVSRAIILEPGAIPERDHFAAPRVISTVWDINIRLFIPWAGQMSISNTNLEADRQEIIDELDKYPTLNGTTDVVNAMLIGARAPEVWVGESRQWWQQDMTYQVRENVIITIAE